MNFKLSSEYQPTGDQPKAIQKLTESLRKGESFQTLLGVTGSGKTFTAANVIANLNRPTLVLSHNKTLAAQLYGEFKHFFPENAVEYFISYYDYYQPESFLPASNTYIEKDLSINEEIEKLRIAATSSLISGRRDVLHCTYEKAPLTIGNSVSIGHRAIVHGCTIEDNVLIGMGAIVMDHAYIENNSLIAAGSVVLENTRVESGSIYAGVPAKKVKELSPEHFLNINERIANNYVKYASWFKEE